PPIHPRPARSIFSAARRICAAPQSRPWSARRDGIAHCARQEGRRYLLRRCNVGARSGAIIVAVSLLPVSNEWSGPAMSLRAELVRLGLRWFVTRKIGPASTLEALRRQDAFLERLVPPPPKGTQATHVDLDGVKAVAVVTPEVTSGHARPVLGPSRR